MSTFPKVVPKPAPNDMVQVGMPQFLAEEFEKHVLPLTKGAKRLSPPMVFSEDDLPTYIIEIG